MGAERLPHQFKRLICDRCDSHWMCVILPQTEPARAELFVALCAGCLRILADDVGAHEGDDQ